MQPQRLDHIRKKAAAASVGKLRNTLDQVRQKYENKHKLRIVLNEPRHDSSISELAFNLEEIKYYATALLKKVGAKDKDAEDRIERPIRWAKDRLSEIELLMKQARALALDLRAFELDRSTFDRGKDTLYDDATDQLSQATGALRGLEKYWDEAFELAAGICLRHEGLDDGLCQIADALIEEINWISGKVFTVPSRHEVGTLSKIVHLRFPEWTIWALPLTAHEVWHLRIRDRDMNRSSGNNRLLNSILEHAEIKKNPDFPELLNSAGLLWGDNSFQCQMADVFGVYSMGAAYACACIFLALDPGDELAKHRALTIFHVLKAAMNYDESKSQPHHIVEVLESHWREVAGNEATLNHEPWINATSAFLQSQTQNSGFSWSRWKADHGKFLEAFDTPKDPEKNSRMLEELRTLRPSIRFVLNAAWRRRVDYPDQTDDLANICKALCAFVMDPTDDRPKNVNSSF